MYLLLLPVIALYSASSLFYKQNKKNSILTLFGVGFWATFFLFIAFLINFGITKHPFANFTWKVYGWIVLKATLVVVCIFTWTKGIKHVPASIAEPFVNIRMFLLLAVSWALFGDKVGYVSIILIVGVFIACVIIGFIQYKTEKQHANAKNYVRGLIWLLAWVGLSVANLTVLKQAVISQVDIVTFVTIEQATYTMLAFIILLVWCYRTKTSVKRSVKEVLRYPIHTGIGSTYLADLMYIPLLLVFNMGVLDAIMVTTIVVVIASVIFLKEKIRWYVYPFIGIIIGCSVALSLLG